VGSVISPALLIILFILDLLFLVIAIITNEITLMTYSVVALLILLAWALFWRFLSIRWGVQRIMVSKPAIAAILLCGFSASVSIFFSTHLLVYTSVFIFTSLMLIFFWSLVASVGLTIKREHLRIALVGQPLDVKITLVNLSRWPRFCVIGFDYFPAASREAGYQEMCFVSVRGFSRISLKYEALPTLRGDWRIGPFYFWGGDPFGFFKNERLVDEYTELIVVPVPFRIRMEALDSVSHRPKDETATIAKPGESVEFLGVREYREGDGMRKIHWRSSAKHGELITKQFELNVASTISFLLLNTPELGRGAEPERTPLEDSLRIIISLAQAAILSGFEVSFTELGAENQHSTRSGSGRQFLSDLSIDLARIGNGTDIKIDDELKWVVKLVPEASSLFVLMASFSNAEKQLFRHLRERFKRLFIVHFDVKSYEKQQPTVNTPRTAGSAEYLLYRIQYDDDLKKMTERILRSVRREVRVR
jgi:uncharacterized protein (DUF58 family)